MAKKDYQDEYTLDEWCDLMGYSTWESLQDGMGDGFYDYRSFEEEARRQIDEDDYLDEEGELDESSYDEAVTERADELLLEAEHEAQRGYYNLWEGTVENGMDAVLKSVKLVAVPAKHIGKHNQTFKIKPANGETWETVLTEIRELINGVGYYTFYSNKELKDSGPYTARQAVLGHLHYLSDYDAVYGGGYGSRWFERELESGSRYL
jgi:hypothetical protein